MNCLTCMEYTVLRNSNKFTKIIRSYEDNNIEKFCEKCHLNAATFGEEFRTVFEGSMRAPYLRNQLFYICYKLRDKIASMDNLDIILGLARSTTSKRIKQLINNRKDGRPTGLTQELKDDIIDIIKTSTKYRRPRIGHIYNRLKFKYDIKYTTLRKYIYQMTDSVRVVKLINRDADRVLVKKSDIAVYLKDMMKLKDIPIEFVTNCDESGYQEYEDMAEGNVVISVEDMNDCIKEGNESFYPNAVYRSRDRMTLVAAINLDGTYLPPLYVLKRKTGDIDIINNVGRSSVYYSYNSSGFINSDLFKWWFNNIYLKYIERRRQELKYEGPAILLMDGCSTHITKDVIIQASLNNVIIKLIPPHSSHIVQALDAVVFSSQKKLINGVHSEGITVQSEDVIKNFNSFHLAASPMNITKSFNRVGIYSVSKKVNDNDYMNFMTIKPRSFENDIFKDYFPDATNDEVPNDQRLKPIQTITLVTGKVCVNMICSSLTICRKWAIIHTR